MGMFESNIDYTKFIQFNGGALRVASFVEIRDALIKRYKEIYGNDIDTSSTSADGQFINEIALIINNIVQTFQFSYDSLDPASAVGKYLDILCSYNNVFRRVQTPSTAELYIYNSGDTPISPRELTFMDRNSNMWIWSNDIIDNQPIITFEPNTVTLIQGVICDKIGSIEAQGSAFLNKDGEETNILSDCDWSKECPGWIYMLVENSPLRVWQYKDAVVGEEEEDDESLRKRRYQMMGNKSISILEGLKGSLLNISGIKDVFIYNNFNGDTNPLLTLPDPYSDGTNILGHSIYVVLRYEEGLAIENSTIGKLIYNKLTPGIGTIPAEFDGINIDDTVPGFKSYDIKKLANVNYTIYWKKAQTINPVIDIKFKCNDNYDYPNNEATLHIATSEVEKNIVKNLQNYINQIKIDSYLQSSNLMNITQQSDRQKNGLPTFYITECTIDNDSTKPNYPANLNYFKYDRENYLFDYFTDSGYCHILIANSTISINGNATMNNNSQQTLSLTTTNIPSDQEVIWSSSDETKATVDPTGIVSSLSTGTVTITCSYGVIKATFDITIS